MAVTHPAGQHAHAAAQSGDREPGDADPVADEQADGHAHILHQPRYDAVNPSTPSVIVQTFPGWDFA
ncbi:hypothetical protein GCM10022223_08370 [Kineosporia mesophila]|uniref:Uncharacterized protein n=1 Tax=Kineosporia mesophila TaxID=566012 RepID=A0ABP6Z1Y2_9ACTN